MDPGDRESKSEVARIADLMGLVPPQVGTAVDVGARDGFLSRLLADRGIAVTALDLEKPAFVDARIACVQGNATALDFDDNTFDLVFCTEVLEHIPSELLEKACQELGRISNRHLLIGVPYKQDLRLDCSTCRGCGKTNPPWGHVNSFDEARLQGLFPAYRMARTEFVGVTTEATNFLSSLLMNMAGNPYGTYIQDEPCIHCDAPLAPPPPRTLLSKILSKAAVMARKPQAPFVQARSKWVHVLFEKQRA